jgi:hypothetical protein
MPITDHAIVPAIGIARKRLRAKSARCSSSECATREGYGML